MIRFAFSFNLEVVDVRTTPAQGVRVWFATRCELQDQDPPYTGGTGADFLGLD